MQRVCQYILCLLPLIYWFKKILWGLVQFKKAVELVKFEDVGASSVQKGCCGLVQLKKVVGDRSVEESCWG